MSTTDESRRWARIKEVFADALDQSPEDRVGWLFFDEAPFAQLIPGVFLIVAGGMLIAWRERRKRVEAPPPAHTE